MIATAGTGAGSDLMVHRAGSPAATELRNSKTFYYKLFI